MSRLEIRKFITESREEVTDIQNAYKEAYKKETGEDLQINSFTFGDVEKKETITIKNVVSNGERLGDITLTNTGEGYTLAY